jgi:hypothetical protein
MPPEKTVITVSGWLYFVLVFVGSTFAGIGRLLWQMDATKPPLSWYRWVGAAFSCGFFGLITSLWLFDDFADQSEKLAAISLLAGLGGSTTFDFALAFLRARFGLRIKDDE